jgi:hypothetical protein
MNGGIYMYIHEAVKRAIEEDALITSPRMEYLAFQPTNGRDCCRIIPLFVEATPGRCWNPTADDLTDDTWELLPLEELSEEIRNLL